MSWGLYEPAAPALLVAASNSLPPLDVEEEADLLRGADDLVLDRMPRRHLVRGTAMIVHEVFKQCQRS